MRSVPQISYSIKGTLRRDPMYPIPIIWRRWSSFWHPWIIGIHMTFSHWIVQNDSIDCFRNFAFPISIFCRPLVRSPITKMVQRPFSGFELWNRRWTTFHAKSFRPANDRRKTQLDISNVEATVMIDPRRTKWHSWRVTKNVPEHLLSLFFVFYFDARVKQRNMINTTEKNRFVVLLCLPFSRLF